MDRAFTSPVSLLQLPHRLTRIRRTTPFAPVSPLYSRHPSRRTFLRQGIACGFLANLPLVSRLSGQSPSKSNPIFEEVPASASHIDWVHTAGKTGAKYLPETSGAGCAFLDFDNDGWVDIYLVNSGKSDLYTPAHPLRNALYRNNRDGTFTDLTAKAGVTGG